MELSQRVEIPLGLVQVWQSLNDPVILKQCLPGCEVFEPIGDSEFNFTLLAKVGPVKARFKGEIKLVDVNPPSSYTLTGAGKGGVAGFVKGFATVRLEEKTEETVTVMTYSVKANVGGKLAQLGARLVFGAARKMANEFFTNFVRVICNDPDGKLEIKLETVKDV
ncbi:MAG: carbon monoxide dehydrogenase subunit G [Gammaproteobacteria bacterium]|nr:carbon monoxide dehydrogenase subunit G [Gammaproteobacteria bacterium]